MRVSSRKRLRVRYRFEAVGQPRSPGIVRVLVVVGWDSSAITPRISAVVVHFVPLFVWRQVREVAEEKLRNVVEIVAQVWNPPSCRAKATTGLPWCIFVERYNEKKKKRPQ